MNMKHKVQNVLLIKQQKHFCTKKIASGNCFVTLTITISANFELTVNIKLLNKNNDE